MNEFLLRRKIKKIQQRIARYGEDAVEYYKLAKLYMQLSQQDAAIECYQQSIEAYYQNDTRLGAGNRFILDVCEKLLASDPLNALAYRTLGQEYCGLGLFDEAITLYKAFAQELTKAVSYEEALLQYRNALVLNSEDIEIRQHCFALLWRLRRKTEAVQEVKKIAELAEQNGNLSKALECYRKALKILPSDPGIQAELTRILCLLRNEEKPLRLVVNK